MSSILYYSTRMRKKLEKIVFKIFFWSPVSRIAPKNVKGDLKKALITSISSASRSSVAVSVSSSQLIKPIKSVTSLIFPGFPPIQKQVNHTLPSYSQYDSRLIILWTKKVYGSSLTIFWAIYGSVYDQPGTINLMAQSMVSLEP